MNTDNKTAISKINQLFFLLILLTGTTGTLGSSLDLPDSPLFLSTSVAPNVFLQLDDSGSMDWEILTVNHWNFCEYDNNAPGGAGSWECGQNRTSDGKYYAWDGQNTADGAFVYIFPNGDNTYYDNSKYRGCINKFFKTMLMCNTQNRLPDSMPYQNDWRILSADFNIVYYDPDQKYAPWEGPCYDNGNPCQNASFTSVRSDPRQGSEGYSLILNLGNNGGFVYEVWEDDKGYSGARPGRGSNYNGHSNPNGEVDLWDSHTRYHVLDSNRIEVTYITYTPNTSGLGKQETPLPAITDPVKVNAIKQNIANWYQYQRRRAFAAKFTIAKVINKYPNFRYGISVINNYNNLFIEFPSAATNHATHNRNLLNELFRFDWPYAGTPLRKGLERVGNYYAGNLSGKADPILPENKGGSCQKHFAVLVTDGYWNKGSPSVGDEDSDGVSPTLADVAKYYYDKDLSLLPNIVAADDFDSATHQHMVTFGISFGLYGNLVDTDGDGWPNPVLAENDNWGNPWSILDNDGEPNDQPAKLDDLWHATFNGKGAFFSAAAPDSLLAGLNKTMEQITGRSNASAATVALSTGYISTNSKVYQARFDNGQWTGQLLSYPLLTDPANFGKLDTSGTGPEGSEWDAADKLPPAASRTILTYDRNSDSGKPFRWDSLSGSQQTALTSANILNYLRGDDSLEQKNGGTLRNRSSKLGDIVNSSPLFVGPPAFRYDRMSGYASFREYNKNRPQMLYIGANDGMLHAFDATTGVEKFAYVPGSVYDQLASLSEPGYIHRFFVDATPVAGDAYYSGNWHTLLAGGLRKGGRGIYLLDVTDPSSFSNENSATGNVLWEFTAMDDPDLGFTYSQPTITRMQNDKWAVIFGNGYNNSGSGNAVLYIAFIEEGLDGWSGSDFIKLDTGAGNSSTPNGLASATPVDVDGDNKVDYIYAGDLLGNLWKFDVNSSNSSNWSVASLGGAGPTPLFQTQIDGSGNRQPVTVRPEVGRTPFGSGIMVYFGTGKFIENSDITSTGKQTFYGVLDNNTPVTLHRLQEQTIENETGFGGSGQQIRITSNNNMAPSDLGWYLNLPVNGERQISNPVLRDRQIIFTTMRPSGNTCKSGGESWLMVLDAFHGSRLQTTPFDLDKDGGFDNTDQVNGKAASGLKIEQITNTPGFATTNDMDYVYLTGNPANEPYKLNPGEATGRKSWRQVR